MIRGVVQLLLGLGFALATSATVNACSYDKPLEITDIRHAELVVRGRVTGYRKIDEGPGRLYGLLSVDVIGTWRGEERESWELRWVNSTFELPDGWYGEREIVVAASDEFQVLRPFVGDEDWPHGERRSGLMQILQAPCAPPFLFSAKPDGAAVTRHRENVKRLRDMMERMPKNRMGDRMRDRMERMLGRDPARAARRRIAALRACVEEDIETCKAVWNSK